MSERPTLVHGFTSNVVYGTPSVRKAEHLNPKFKVGQIVHGTEDLPAWKGVTGVVEQVVAGQNAPVYYVDFGSGQKRYIMEKHLEGKQS